MPGRNGTGPMGNGPMTGWGMGSCAVRVDGGFVNPKGLGRAMGRGRFCGMGWWNRFSGAGFGPRGFGRRVTGWNTEDELTTLQQQAQAMEANLNNLRTRIDQLKSAPRDQ